MNVQIKWYYLVIGGVIANFVPTIFGGNPITYGISVIGVLCFIFGLIELARMSMKKRGEKK